MLSFVLMIFQILNSNEFSKSLMIHLIIFIFTLMFSFVLMIFEILMNFQNHIDE
jgi:hypothetical protein